MLKRRVFSVVLAVLMLMTFIACWTVQASASTTEGTTQVIWGQRGGGSAAFLHHNDVTGGAYRTIGVRFNALNAFDKIYIATGSTNKDITYTVYPWLGTYEMTKSGTPVAQVTETMTSNFVTVTLPTPVAAGEYLLLLSTTSESTHVWTYAANSAVAYYYNDVKTTSEHEALAGGIGYVGTTSATFGALTTTHEQSWGQIGGGSSAFLHHAQVTGGEHRSIGVRFVANNAFYQFNGAGSASTFTYRIYA